MLSSWVIALAAAGCDATPPAPVTQRPAPSASATPEPPKAELPKAFERLGTPCESQAKSKPGPDLYVCGKHGTIAAVVKKFPLVRGMPPSEAETIIDRKEQDRLMHRKYQRLLLAHEGKRVWMQEITCPSCRAVLGTAVVADVDQLDAKGVDQLRTRLRLSAAADLATVNGWRVALEKR